MSQSFSSIFNLFSLLILATLFIHTLSVLPTVPYTYPTLFADTTGNLATTNISAPMKDFKVTDSYIARLSTTGFLNIWDADNLTLLYSLFYGTSFNGTLVITDFVFSSDDKYLGVTTSTKLVIVYDMSTNPISQINKIPFTNTLVLQGVQMLQTEIIVFWTKTSTAPVYSNYFTRFTLQVGTTISTPSYFSLKTFILTNLKGCDFPNLNMSTGYYYVVSWKDQCYFQIMNCTVASASSCVSTYSYIVSACNSTDWAATQPEVQVEFSYDCKYLAFQEKGVGIRVFDIAAGTFTNRNYPKTANFKMSTVTFTDKQNIYLGAVAADGNYKAHQHQPNGKQDLYSYNMSNSGGRHRLHRKKKRFMTASDTSIEAFGMKCDDPNMILYAEGYCILCQSNCVLCDPQGVCSQCQVNYTLTNNTCILSSSSTPPAIPNNTNTNPSTNPNPTPNPTTPNNTQTNTPNNTQNNITSPTTNQTQSNQLLTMSKSDQFLVNPVYSYEDDIGKFVHQHLSQPVINVAVNAIAVLQIFPFAFLFLRFINFWSICSFYLLTGFPMPKHLTYILLIIYQRLNDSIFDKIGIPNQFKLSSHQKITGYLSDRYGITSDFIDTNFENFCICVFSCVILGIFYWLRNHLSHKNIFYRMFSKIDFPKAVLGQFVSIMGSFFTNMSMIERNSYQTNSYEKLNMSMQFLFIGMSLGTFGVSYYLTYCDLYDELDEKKEVKPEDKKALEAQARQWILSCFYNSVVPGLAVMGRIYIFYSAIAVLFVYGTYAAWNELEFRLNCVLLSLELIVFHIGFIILIATYELGNAPLFHHVGLCMVMLVFVGALHQLLTFVFGIIYEIGVGLCSRNSVIPEEQVKPIHKGANRISIFQSDMTKSKLAQSPQKTKEQKKRKIMHFIPRPSACIKLSKGQEFSSAYHHLSSSETKRITSLAAALQSQPRKVTAIPKYAKRISSINPTQQIFSFLNTNSSNQHSKNYTNKRFSSLNHHETPKQPKRFSSMFKQSHHKEQKRFSSMTTQVEKSGKRFSTSSMSTEAEKENVIVRKEVKMKKINFHKNKFKHCVSDGNGLKLNVLDQKPDEEDESETGEESEYDIYRKKKR